jgi:hypothetical protein
MNRRSVLSSVAGIAGLFGTVGAIANPALTMNPFVRRKAFAETLAKANAVFKNYPLEDARSFFAGVMTTQHVADWAVTHYAGVQHQVSLAVKFEEGEEFVLFTLWLNDGEIT